MTSATLERRGLGLDPVRHARMAALALRHALGIVISPHKASLLRLLDMPLAVLGTGLFDWAFFSWSRMAGLIVTGLSLWLVEHLIADPPDGLA